MLRLKRQNKLKCRNNYSLPQDPYLDIVYHVIATLMAVCVLLIFYMIFQWPDFLIFVLISAMFIFMSALPFGQSHWGQVKASLVTGLGLWVCFVGVFIFAWSRSWLIAWVFCYTLGYYVVTLRNNSLKIHLGLSVVFLPIFIHLIDDASSLMPVNSVQVFINYTIAIVICTILSVSVALLEPRRYEAKVLLAMTEYIYALRRMLISADSKGYRNNLSCMFAHLYYLRQQKGKFRKNFDADFSQMIDEYTEVVYQTLMIYVYMINNHDVKLPFYQACANIDALLGQEDLSVKQKALNNQAHLLSLAEANLQLKQALEHVDLYIQKLGVLYQNVKRLRNKYV